MFDGMSLNCAMRTGPNLLNTILRIMLNMRFGKFISGIDISKMFFRIALREEDKKYFRILINDVPYQFNVLPFGVKAAPAMANFVVRYILEQSMDKSVVDKILRLSYMDDLNMTSNSEEQLLKWTKMVVKALEESGMPCAKMITNSPLTVSYTHLTLPTKA